MRIKKQLVLYIAFALLLASIQPATIKAQIQKEQSIIIEVEGDPYQRKRYIKDYHPFIEVVQVYDTIFNGLALRAKPSQLNQMESVEFIKKMHPVRTYQATTTQSLQQTQAQVNQSIPFIKDNSLPYTGEGIKIGVIDTGIDHTHPDLEANYKGGYDLVDLDDDPMETTLSQGMPTIHGTHVSGIIAGNGQMKGVAPEAELYGYRALGPGGMGTSVQVIAAIEKAVKDEMDIINMSLGNTVNGPDWPTSVAVNRAIELGVSVVIANGNSGPNNWTVGSPATSTNAISVGASTPPLKVPYLFDSFHKKEITLTPLLGSTPWNLTNDYQLVDGGIGKKPPHNAERKIVLMERGEVPFTDKAKKAEQAGAKALIIYNNEEGTFQGALDESLGPISIPVAAVSKEDGQWLKETIIAQQDWMDTRYKQTQDEMAAFSSRGPVTTNWHIKPEIVAPGAAITSTVPGGYQELQGTSMAAPHVAGGLALVKQAHPDWSPEQLKGALLTTALPLKNATQMYEPITQGMGRMQIDEAIHTSTIIHNPLLSFGKVKEMKEKHSVQLEIENVSNKAQTYHFELPDQQQGLRWHLPRTFIIEPNSKKKVELQLDITSSQLEKGLHQGWLTLKQEEKTYQLAYLFLNKEGDYPKAMGIEFALKTFSDQEYAYRLYLPEEATMITVDLYNPRTLQFERTLLELDQEMKGVVEGTIKKRNLGKPGSYLANITVETVTEEKFSYPIELMIEE